MLEGLGEPLAHALGVVGAVQLPEAPGLAGLGVAPDGESLRRERAELRSPERLAQVAAANGMVPARGSEFLEITVDVRSLVAASTGDIDPAHLGVAGNTLDDFRDVKATTAAAAAAP